MADQKPPPKSSLFPKAISVEELKQHDPSVSFSCEKLSDDKEPPGPPGATGGSKQEGAR